MIYFIVLMQQLDEINGVQFYETADAFYFETRDAAEKYVNGIVQHHTESVDYPDDNVFSRQNPNDHYTRYLIMKAFDGDNNE